MPTRADRAAAKHAREYYTIIAALHQLEKHLASPAPGREREWKRRAAAALTAVVDRLKAHCRAAESDGGVLANEVIALGRTRAVSSALRQHKTIIADARQLLADIKARQSATPDEVRRRAARLASALRAHQALEADIIIDTYDRVYGAGD
jgi:hypothetical protein